MVKTAESIGIFLASFAYYIELFNPDPSRYTTRICIRSSAVPTIPGLSAAIIFHPFTPCSDLDSFHRAAKLAPGRGTL